MAGGAHTQGENVFLKQLDDRARHFIAGTELHLHNEHILGLIGDQVLARLQERQLVLVVHLLH